MKKGQLLIDWEGMARTRGYGSAKEMLRAYYLADRLSTAMIEGKLKVDRRSVAAKLKSLKIPMRGRGGANNKKRG